MVEISKPVPDRHELAGKESKPAPKIMKRRFDEQSVEPEPNATGSVISQIIANSKRNDKKNGGHEAAGNANSEYDTSSKYLKPSSRKGKPSS